MIILRPWRAQYETRSGTRAMVPSSFITSQITPAGPSPARVCEVNGSFCLARSFEYATALCLQGEHVAGLHQIPWTRIGVDGDLDGTGAVGGGDARRDSVSGLDGHGECCLEAGLVLGRHEILVQVRRTVGRSAPNRSGPDPLWP